MALVLTGLGGVFMRRVLGVFGGLVGFLRIMSALRGMSEDRSCVMVVRLP